MTRTVARLARHKSRLGGRPEQLVRLGLYPFHGKERSDDSLAGTQIASLGRVALLFIFCCLHFAMGVPTGREGTFKGEWMDVAPKIGPNPYLPDSVREVVQVEKLVLTPLATHGPPSVISHQSQAPAPSLS